MSVVNSFTLTLIKMFYQYVPDHFKSVLILKLMKMSVGNSITLSLIKNIRLIWLIKKNKKLMTSDSGDTKEMI